MFLLSVKIIRYTEKKMVPYTSISLCKSCYRSFQESASKCIMVLQEFSGLDSMKMVITLNITVIAYTLIFAAWLANRIHLQRLTDQVQLLKTRVASRLQGEDS